MQAVNHETGIVQPVEEVVGKVARDLEQTRTHERGHHRHQRKYTVMRGERTPHQHWTQ